MLGCSPWPLEPALGMFRFSRLWRFEPRTAASAVLVIAVVALAPHESGADEGDIRPTTIRVIATGLRHTNGDVRMSLFGTKEGFPDRPEHSLQWGFASVAGDSATYAFTPVPAGRYAASTFHDEDGDGAMRRDFVGRPREGWGVSRDAKARFGPPSFDAAAFDTQDDTVTVRVRMRY